MNVAAYTTSYLLHGQLVKMVYIRTKLPSSGIQMSTALIILTDLFLLSTVCWIATVKGQEGTPDIFHFVLILIFLLFYFPMLWSYADRINFYSFCLSFWQSCGNTECSSDFIQASFISSSLLLLLCNFIDKTHFIRIKNMQFSTWISYLCFIFGRNFKPSNKK